MLLKVCSRSHGQPCCGSRRRAISASSALKARSASLIGAGSDTEPIEGEEHPGGGAPDIAVAEGDVEKLHLLVAACGAAAVPVVIGRIEQVLERHLEGFLNLLGVEQQLEVRLHEGHHRRDAKAGVHEVVRQVTDYRHEALGETDLLTRFAQCRRDRAAVRALDAPAWKTD